MNSFSYLKTKWTALTLLAAMAMSAPTEALAKQDVRVPENRVVYEVFVRNFGATSSRVGKLTDVTAQLDRLKNMGVDVIWLMPPYTEGGKDKWGTYSSPYAVKNYTEIDSKYGSLQDLKNLVNAAHQRGMVVWLDWVANHTSTDAVWTSNHKDYYVNGNNGFYHPSGWNDVYELEYSSTAMRNAMIDAMKYWVREAGIDGFRLDNTDGVPNDFWQQCRSAVDSYASSLGKSLEWLAETGNNNLYNFDGNNSRRIMDVFGCNYAWSFADYLRSIGSGVNVSGIAGKVAELHNDNTYKNKTRLMYLANHDVQQDKGGSPDKFFGANLKPMTVLYFTCYGMPMIYNGQEVRNSVGSEMLAEKYTINWNGNDDGMTALFTKLAYIKHTEPALRTGSQSGQLINHTCSNGNVYVYERRSGSSSVVVMLNFGNSSATFNVTSALPSNNYKEAFTNKSQNFGSNKSFTLAAHGYAVWTTDDGTINGGSTGSTSTTTSCKITFKRPSNWTATPHVHVYDGNGDIATDKAMTAVSGKSGYYEYTIKVSGGYNVMFNNGGWSGGQSDGAMYEATPGNYTYTLDSNLKVVRYTEPAAPQGKNIKITFKRPSSWTATPHVHVYNGSGDLATDKAMTAVSGKSGFYEISLSNVPDGYNVMFNNGGWSGGQSDGAMYEATAGNYEYTLDSNLKVIRYVAPKGKNIKITFKRPSSWANTPHVHAWNAEGDIATDKAMTAVSGKSGYYEYTIKVSGGYNVMFNNGGWSGGQSDGAMYEATPGNYTYTLDSNLKVVRYTEPAAPQGKNIKITFKRPSSWTATPHVHVYNGSGDLATDKAMTAVAGKTGFYEISLSNVPDGYNVMFNNGGWSGGQSDGAMYEATAGNYEYTLDSNLKVIRYVAPKGKNIKITFKRPSSWANTPHVHAWNAEGDIATDKAMTAVSGKSGFYEITINDVADGYNVMFNNGGWSGGQSANSMYEATAGNYEYTLDGNLNVIRYVAPATKDITIRFVRPSFWGNTPHIHVYYTDGGTDKTLANDVEMTSLGGNFYKATVKNVPDGFNVMFNNGGWGNGQSNAYYQATAANGVYTIDSSSNVNKISVPSGRYVFVENNTNWSSQYLYAWNSNGNGPFGAWPGAKPSTTLSIGGHTYCLFLIPESSYGNTYYLIFNSNSKQANDFSASFSANVYFTVSSSGSANKVAAGVENVAIDADNSEAPIEIYTLNGQRIDTDTPAPGIYIVRQGTSVKKVRF